MPGDDENTNTPNEENEELEDGQDSDDDIGDNGASDEDIEDPAAPAAPSEPAPAASNLDREREELLRRAIEAETRLNYQTSSKERAAEEDRLNNMSDSERVRYEVQKLATNQANFQAQMMFQQQDLADRTAFLNKVSANPKLSKYAEEVEKELTGMRKTGQNTSREVVLQWVIGRNAYKSLTGGNATKQKKQGQANVAAAKSKATSSKGNVVPITKEGNSLRKRLENKFI